MFFSHVNFFLPFMPSTSEDRIALTVYTNIRTVSYQLLFIFVIVDSFLAGWDRNRENGAFGSAHMANKPVKNHFC